MDDHHSVPCLMSVLTSDCTGMPIQRLRTGTRMRTVWNTGAFLSPPMAERVIFQKMHQANWCRKGPYNRGCCFFEVMR